MKDLKKTEENSENPFKFSLSEEEMTEVIGEDDFNEALILTQGYIGQNYGDNAGIHFSGHDDDDLQEVWDIQDKRKLFIKKYLGYEKKYYDFINNKD